MKIIKELFGNDCKTPADAIEILENKYDASNLIEGYDLDSFIFCGEKSRYVFNHLFGDGVVLMEEEIKKYELLPENTVISYLYDGDADCAWSEDIEFFREENIPYIACLDKPFTDVKSFLNTLSLICKETEDFIKFECFVSENGDKSGFDIDNKGNVSFYGPTFKMDFETQTTLLRCVYRFLLSFNSKSFEDINSLPVPVEYVNCDSAEEFEQFFEAAGFKKL